MASERTCVDCGHPLGRDAVISTQCLNREACYLHQLTKLREENARLEALFQVTQGVMCHSSWVAKAQEATRLEAENAKLTVRVTELETLLEAADAELELHHPDRSGGRR